MAHKLVAYSDGTIDGPAFLWNVVSQAFLKGIDALPSPISKIPLYTHYDKTLCTLKKMGISRPTRFKDHATAEAVIASREHIRDTKDQRPIALLIFSSFPWLKDGAVQQQISSLISHGYTVLYYEVQTGAELFRIVSHVAGHKHIELFSIGGEGTPCVIYFRRDKQNKMYQISTLKKTAQRLAASVRTSKLPEQLAGTKIVLESCSTGLMHAQALNSIANYFGSIFTLSTIYSPVDTISDVSFVYNDVSRITDVLFSGGACPTYIIEPTSK